MLGNHWSTLVQTSAREHTWPLLVTYQHSCGCCWPTCDLCCTRSSRNPVCSHICACSSGSGRTHLCLQGHAHTKVPAVRQIKVSFPAKRQNGTAETGWLTYTAVSTPLVAHGALAGVGTFGVVARLFGTASVSASGTFIYVCRKKTHTQTPKSYRDEAARESSFPFKNASLVKTINMFGLHDLCDLWCVNCVSSQSQTCDHRAPWASCTSTQRTRSHKERAAK